MQFLSYAQNLALLFLLVGESATVRNENFKVDVTTIN